MPRHSQANQAAQQEEQRRREERQRRKEHLSHLKQEMKQADEAYSALDKHLNQDKLAFAFSKNERRRDFFALYQQEIDEVLQLNDEEQKEVGKFENLLGAYRHYYLTSPSLAQSPEEADMMSQVHGQALAKDKREKDGTDENLSKNISEAQKNGIRDIEKWMYRNANHKGLAVAQSSKQRFIHHILMLPPRMKLLMFYLIENAKRHNPEYGDVLASQINYQPNLENFKDKMVASKWKIGLRLTGDQIRWDKLEDTLQIARQATPLLAMFGAIGDVGNVSLQGSENQNAVAAGANAANDNMAQQAQVRQEKLMAFLNSVAEVQRLENDASASEDQKVAARASSKTAYEELATADANMAKEFDSPYEKSDKAQEYAETAVEIIDTSVAPGAMLGDYTGLKKKDYSWGMPNATSDTMGKVATVFGSAATIAQFAGAILSIVSLIKSGEFKDLSLSERTDVVSGMITGSIDSIASVVTSGFDIAEWAGSKLAESVGETVGAGASIAVGALHMGKGAFTSGKSLYQLYQGGKIRHQLTTENLSPEDKETLSEIMGIQERVAESHAVSGATEVVQGALQVAGGILTLTGVGALAGAILSAAGTVIGLANSVREYFARRQNRDRAIDGYLKVEPLTDIVYDRVQTKFPSKKFEKSKIHKQVRNEMIATLGFASKDSFYTHITHKYADFLHKRAFYKDVTDTEGHVARQRIYKHETALQDNIYAKAIKSFGLKLHFPVQRTGNNNTTEDEPRPDVATIASKMVI